MGHVLDEYEEIIKEVVTKENSLALTRSNNGKPNRNDKNLAKNFKRVLRNKNGRTKKKLVVGVVPIIILKLVSSSMKR